MYCILSESFYLLKSLMEFLKMYSYHESYIKKYIFYDEIVTRLFQQKIIVRGTVNVADKESIIMYQFTK